MDYGLYLFLLPIGMFFALLMFIFVFIADIWERLFIGIVLLFTSISIFIIKTEAMHNFISYLTNIGFTGSIYWILYGLSIPVILLFAKPLVDAVNNKSVLVKCITGFLFAIFIWALILPVVAEFAYRMYHM